MDKRVIFAVAGSGKTTLILSRLDLEKRCLIVTYTINNIENLRTGIISKFGYFPNNIKLLSYFNFLYTYCYRPFLGLKFSAKGINWNPNPNPYAKEDDRFIDKNKRLYSNRISKLLETSDIVDEVNSRLSKYFDNIYFDEIQDFAGNDFNFLKKFSKANINMLFVGDFYQHTFDTSRDGNVNSSLHDDYLNYQNQFKKMGLQVDTTSLSKSYRCSPTVCSLVSNRIGISIDSHRTDAVEFKKVDNDKEAMEIYVDDQIVKLFYSDRRKYSCFGKNWGECKGEDRYEDVCVVMNKKSWTSFEKDELHLLPPSTKNKLYVACTRAKRNLFFVPEEYFKGMKSIV